MGSTRPDWRRWNERSSRSATSGHRAGQAPIGLQPPGHHRPRAPSATDSMAQWHAPGRHAGRLHSHRTGAFGAGYRLGAVGNQRRRQPGGRRLPFGHGGRRARAALLGKPAIAISQYRRRREPVDWERSSRWTRQIVSLLLSRPHAAGTFWNVNLPDSASAAGRAGGRLLPHGPASAAGALSLGRRTAPVPRRLPGPATRAGSRRRCVLFGGDRRHGDLAAATTA